uniref:Uncharacterized protein LOC104236503 n=1 Tax=Nicotiana sylvestris TaxID=4096 RepID=A0A1U7XP55_NICSY|nr:PREDICTED: uncharacterized protein LOC104236503 [Nicotiana sylvestris]
MNIVVPETNPDSKENADDLVYASFIRAMTKLVVTLEPPTKRPTKRLQQKDALEFAPKKNKMRWRRRRLVKDGKVLQEEDVPVEDVDEETKEEPSSLTRKSSRKKHSLSLKPKGTPLRKELVKSFGDKTVKERGDKCDEEEVEKSGEHRQSKSVEKEKSIGKSVKRKRDDDDEEPGSVKKGKVSETLRSEKRKLGNRKVLWGRTFSSNILESAGMRKLVDICDAQQWTNLFTSGAPIVYEDEVQSFYTSLFIVDGDQICVLVNGVDIVMDSALLGSILGVPIERVSSAQGAFIRNFRNAIIKDKAVHHGEHVHKKALLLVYQLFFEIVNKVLLPHAERIFVPSKGDLYLMETLDNFSSINLPSIMIEHMKKVENLKDGNPGLPYGFLLTKVFEFFKVPLGQAKVGTEKQSFSKTTLEECQLQEVLSSSGSHSAEVARLTKENAELRKQSVVENNESPLSCKSPILVNASDFVFAIYATALLFLSSIML